MKLAWILWLANLLPQPAADQLCLVTTVYLEARNQSELGQRAVAEVALRRLDSGRWGDTMCEVVTAPKQFAPTLISPNFSLSNVQAWTRAARIALELQRTLDYFDRTHQRPPPRRLLLRAGVEGLDGLGASLRNSLGLEVHGVSPESAWPELSGLPESARVRVAALSAVAMGAGRA